MFTSFHFTCGFGSLGFEVARTTTSVQLWRCRGREMPMVAHRVCLWCARSLSKGYGLLRSLVS